MGGWLNGHVLTGRALKTDRQKDRETGVAINNVPSQLKHVVTEIKISKQIIYGQN